MSSNLSDDEKLKICGLTRETMKLKGITWEMVDEYCFAESSVDNEPVDEIDFDLLEDN